MAQEAERRQGSCDSGCSENALDGNYQLSGLVQIKTVTQINAVAWIARTIGLTPNKAGIAKLTMIDAVAIHFTRRRIAPPRRQSAMGGPNRGCSISHV